MRVKALFNFWRFKVFEVFPKKVNEEKLQASLDRLAHTFVVAAEYLLKEEKENPPLMSIQKPSEQKINI